MSYVENLRSRYDALAASVTEVQNRAVAEGRDMTDEELRTVASNVEAGKAIYAQFGTAVEQESRTQSVNDMAAKLAEGAAKTETRAAGISAAPRDPGHYRKAVEGGQHSFFGDMFRAQKQGDAAAATRLNEHSVALRTNQTFGTEPGVLPPVWMSDEYTTIKQNGRVISNAVRNVPLADARPFSLPGQTASAVIATQTNQNDALTAGDAYASAAVTITPSTIDGMEIVSRQLLESSTPAIDQLIFADLIESYNTKVEALVGAAVRGVGSLLTGAAIPHANFVDVTGVTGAYSAWQTAVQLQSAVYSARYLRPDYIAMDHNLFATYLGLVDTDGRPIMVNPMVAGQAQNPIGVGGAGNNVVSDGFLAGLPILVSDSMVIDSTHDGIAAMRSQDVVLFEKAGPALFRFEEVAGPSSIKLCLWNYVATAVRQGTRSVKNASVLTS